MTKAAIYGLSTETEKELPGLRERYQIIGLLDGFRTDGELYGQPILSFDRAVAKGVEEIIVVARPGSCKAIARRIGDACKELGIALFDIRGKDLLARERVVYDFKGVKGYRYAELLEQVKRAEAVSFDLFDTLVMRRVLSPYWLRYGFRNGECRRGILQIRGSRRKSGFPGALRLSFRKSMRRFCEKAAGACRICYLH